MKALSGGRACGGFYAGDGRRELGGSGGDEDQVRATGGESMGEGEAESGGGASEEDCLYLG